MIPFTCVNFSAYRIPTIRHNPHGREDADDRNHDQEFDEGEAFLIVKKNTQSKSIISIK